MTIFYLTTDSAKELAKTLRQEVKPYYSIKLNQAYEATAALFGCKSWPSLMAQMPAFKTMNVDGFKMWLHQHNKNIFSPGIDRIIQVLINHELIKTLPTMMDVGVAITLSDEEMMRENAKERDIDFDAISAEAATSDLLRLEKNIFNALSEKGFFVRSEGHDTDDNHIATALFSPADKELLSFVVTGLSEAYSESNFNVNLFEGLETPIKDVTDVSVTFFTSDDMRDLYEELSNG